MTSEQAEARLQRLSDSVERVRANLLEFDLDGDLKLLEESSLEGETAVRWAEAKARIIDLWRWLGALEQLLERAARLGSGRRPGQDEFSELAALLEGPSVELRTDDVPLAQRTLLGDSQTTLRCTPDELLARMAESFEVAKGVVTAAGAAWQAYIPRVTAARATIAECAALAGELGGEHGGELEAARLRLVEVSALITRDPLSVGEPLVDELSRTVEAVHRELESVNELRLGIAIRLAQAREQLGALRALARQGEAAYARRLSRIADTNAPGPFEIDPGLDSELARIFGLADQARWHDAHAALRSWMESVAASLDAARSVLAANRAPVESRDELRALLGAYQVKAGRLGVIEDRRVRELFARAEAALYTAPTNLVQAQELVRACQAELSGGPVDREVRR
jgi:hypothetical protein